jgi:pilus assembly protein CpaE
MTTILLVDDDKMIHKLVSAALEADGYELIFAKNGQEGFEIIKRVIPNLILLDLVLPDMDGYQICKILRNDPRTTNVPIIMLTGVSDLDNRLKAFQAGVDDFLSKPFQFEELQARVRVQLRWVSTIPSQPKINTPIHKIALFSLRGGVGISTLAVNLAAGLSQLWNSPTLLADMAFLNGQSALMLNARPRNTWTDIGNINPEEIESEILEKVVLHHPTGVDLLAAPRNVAEAELITEKHVQRIIELAGGHYKYLIMDLPHDFSLTTLAALDMADRILLLTAPDLGSVYSASNALKVLRDIGYEDEKVQLVLNWNFSTKGLARKNIEDALQKRISVIIPNMPDSLVMAITMGKPVVLEPDKKEAAVFEDLAYFWSTEEDKKNTPATPNKVWLRVMERAKLRQEK